MIKKKKAKKDNRTKAKRSKTISKKPIKALVKRSIQVKKEKIVKKLVRPSPAEKAFAKAEEKVKKVESALPAKIEPTKARLVKAVEKESQIPAPSIPKQLVSEKQKTSYGLIEPQPIIDEMRKSYLDYAMSVIVSRALPDVRDGLKPVHRRILYAMWNLGLRAGARFRKSATVVGEVLGKFHPHGDIAVYDSMVRMVQDFSLRYPLVRGQGNFGSMDGDSAAAMRYTEVKLAAIAEELLFDLEKKTVNFNPNFDGSQQEPRVLPAKLPNLLLNGTMGIAVGMATNIPPHNLTEVTQAIIYLIDKPQATVEDLMQFIKGPDFPTAGLIFNQKDILQAYATGKSGIVMRGQAEIQESKTGNFQIIISQIPFQVNKASLVEKIAELVKDKKVEGIKDLRDESNRQGVRIVIDLKKDTYPKKILNSLYKQTQLQETFHVNMLALIDGLQPKVLTLKMILEECIKHRIEVVKRRSKFDLDKAGERAHILQGLMIALNQIEAVIKTIKASRDREAAKVSLIKKFKLTEPQALAILEMKLATLANLERQKIENELKEKQALIKELTAILESMTKIRRIIKKETQDLAEKYGDQRKTKVMAHGVKDFAIEDLVPNEEAMVMMTRDGYIKRVASDTFKVQGRGGKGVLGLTTKEEDNVEFIFTTLTHNDILFFTTRGRVFQLKAYEIPQAARTAKGTPIVNFLQLAGGEKITSILPIDKLGSNKFLFFVTEKGLVKKVKIEAFANVRRSGLIAIKIKEDDKLIWTKPTSGSDQIQLITTAGQAIRFQETDVREMGRNAVGVRGIRLKKENDAVVGMGVIKKEEKERLKKLQVLAITEQGYGKRTALGYYKVQGRGGSGIKTAKVTTKTGRLINAFIVNAEAMENKDLIIISEQGQVIRLPFKSVNQLGRDTQGVRLMRFKEPTDKVACMTWV